MKVFLWNKMGSWIALTSFRGPLWDEVGNECFYVTSGLVSKAFHLRSIVPASKVFVSRRGSFRLRRVFSKNHAALHNCTSRSETRIARSGILGLNKTANIVYFI